MEDEESTTKSEVLRKEFPDAFSEEEDAVSDSKEEIEQVDEPVDVHTEEESEEEPLDMAVEESSPLPEEESEESDANDDGKSENWARGRVPLATTSPLARKMPTIETDDWETDLETGNNDEGDPTGLQTYYKACKEFQAVPVSFFVRHMHQSKYIMKHHGLGVSGGRAMASCLRVNVTITSLTLEDNWLEDEGAGAIADALGEDNTRIIHLDLSKNRIKEEGGIRIAKMLATNKTITSLNISGNEFGAYPTVAEAFAESIGHHNKTLEILNMSRCGWTGDAVGATLGEMVEKSFFLRELDLSWNALRMRAAVSLGKGIANNQRLEKLDLSWNGLDDRCAAAFGKALSTNTTIKILDVSHNRFSIAAATAFGRALKENWILEELNLGWNPIPPQGVLLIFRGIQEHQALQILSLQKIPRTREVAEAMEVLMEENKVIQHIDF